MSLHRPWQGLGRAGCSAGDASGVRANGRGSCPLKVRLQVSLPAKAGSEKLPILALPSVALLIGRIPSRGADLRLTVRLFLTVRRQKCKPAIPARQHLFILSVPRANKRTPCRIYIWHNFGTLSVPKGGKSW